MPFGGVHSRHPRQQNVLLCGGPKGRRAGKTFAFWSFDDFHAAMAHLEPIIEPVMEAAGFRLVRLRLMGGHGKTLQIMAERPDGSMDVEDCATLSRALLDFIEAEDPIEGDYETRSLVARHRPAADAAADFTRWTGHEAKIELHRRPIDGRKRFRGKLLGLDGNDVVIAVAGQRAQFPFTHHRGSQARSDRQAHRRRFEGAQSAPAN